MAEVASRNPNLASQIACGLAEHVRLSLALTELRSMALRRADQDGVRSKLFAWMNLVGKHEHIENQMVQEAFNIDIGRD